MQRFIAGLVVAIFLTVSIIVGHAPDAPAAGANQKMLRHMVLYQFQDDLKPEQVQEVIDAFAALPAKIDAIIGFEHGTNVSQEGKSEGLTHAFVVTFRDKAGLDAYLVHPAHLEYVKVVRDKREKVVVFDYWSGD